MTQSPSRPATASAAPPTRRRGKVNWVAVAVFLVIGAGLVFYIETYKPFSAQTLKGGNLHRAVGREVPNFTLEPLNVEGEPVTLDSFKDQYLVVNFWGTWCEPCRGELPTMAEIARQWQNDRVKVLAVSCAQRDPENVDRLREETAAFLKEVEVDDLTIYHDPQHAARDIFRDLGAFSAYPTTILIGPDRKILAVFEGYHLVQSQRGINAVLTQALKH